MKEKKHEEPITVVEESRKGDLVAAAKMCTPGPRWEVQFDRKNALRNTFLKRIAYLMGSLPSRGQ